jgi:hypothetical protein
LDTFARFDLNVSTMRVAVMTHRPSAKRLLVTVCWLTSCAFLAAQPPAATKAPEKKAGPAAYVRLQKDGNGQPTALETATVRFIAPAGQNELIVDLVGVVHVADKDYYDRLNRALEEYDVVLYELVAPPGTRIPKGGKRDSDNPVAMIQRIMKSVLNLELQTEQIDYTRKHFVHADLSPEQMAEAVKERGDDGLTIALGIAADMLRQKNLQERNSAKNPPPAVPDLDLGELLTDPDGPAKLKRVLAQQMAQLEDPTGGLGQTLNMILVSDRNKACLKVFQKELAKGRKKIAIFYGAAHMPDFEKRLGDEFGLKRTKEEWQTAWDLKKQGSALEGLLKELLK